MTLNELTFDLWNLIRPHISDDDSIDKRHIAFWIKNQRALWLRNELNKNRTPDPDIIQDLGCIDLEVADAADCCEITDGCKILRTDKVLPATIELHNKTGITRVAPINKLSVAFNFVPYERAIWSGNGRFNSKQIFAFLLNGRIYLRASNDELLKYVDKINVHGIFEDPVEAAKFSHCDGTACYTDDSPYPLKSWMVELMKTEILKVNMATIMQAPVDADNNAKSDNVNESQ